VTLRASITLPAAVIAATVFAGASGATTPSVRALVLRLADLSAGYTVSGESTWQPNGRGPLVGYGRSYERKQTRISSAADRSSTINGAHIRLHERSASYEASGEPSYKRRQVPARVGDESRMYSTSFNGRIELILLWRYRTIGAVIEVIGLRGGVDEADVLALARRQQARIAAAVG
jgi:hypothetical protein